MEDATTTTTTASQNVYSCVHFSSAFHSLKRQLTHKDGCEMAHRAADLPTRFHDDGLIEWGLADRLREEIDQIVWSTYNKVLKMTSSQDLHSFFRDAIYQQVHLLMREKYRLQLTLQDEAEFKSVNLATLTHS